MFANSEQPCARWTHNLLASRAIVAWPNLAPNETSNATSHKSHIIRQQVGFASQVEINPSATRAGTWARILNSDFDRKTCGSMFRRILRSPFDDFAGPDIDPIS